MLDFLIDIDTQLLLFLNSLHSDLGDRFMMAATGRFVWIPMYATILFIFFRTFSRREALLWTLAVVLTILFADQVCATLLRPQFERLRPANPENPVSGLLHLVNDYRGGRYGFPSCHGANSFALATILSLILRTSRFTRFIFLWAALNAYTRIYLGVHYPGDILVGAIIGTSGAAAIYWLFSRFLPASRKEESRILLAYPAGPLAPVMGLKVVYVRVLDILPAAEASTVLGILAYAVMSVV